MPFSCATKRVPPIKRNARFPKITDGIEAHSFGKRKLERESERERETDGDEEPDSEGPSGSFSAKVSLDIRT